MVWSMVNGRRVSNRRTAFEEDFNTAYTRAATSHEVLQASNTEAGIWQHNSRSDNGK